MKCGVLMRESLNVDKAFTFFSYYSIILLNQYIIYFFCRLQTDHDGRSSRSYDDLVKQLVHK